MPFNKARKRAKEIETDLLSRNDAKERDFTNKEVYLLLLDEMNNKLDKHIIWSEELCNKYIPEFNKQIEILNRVCNELPDKGWCGKVDKMYADLYPDNEDTLHDKVETLWYDRKILKWILGTSIAVLITGLITLGVGFMKGIL